LTHLLTFDIVFTVNGVANMETVTVAMRLSKAEARQLDEQAKRLGMERPTFLKRALRRGANDLAFEGACEAYRRGDATLSRAADLAGLRLPELIARMRSAGLELSYGTEELESDLRR